MSLRTIPTLDGSGSPINVIITPQVQVDFSCASVVVNSVHDDGLSITAIITFANGMQKTLTLFSGDDYQAIKNFSDANINAQIVAKLNS